MKIPSLRTSCILLVLLALAVIPVVNAADIVEKSGGVSYVYVTSVDIEPEVFYPYEQGSVTVTLTNNGNSSIGVKNPNLLASSNDISIVKEDKWQTMSYLSAGNSISYTFLVTVNGMDGKYFGLFTTETSEEENLHYPLTFEVDSEDLHAAISKRPETFTIDSESDVNLSLINARDGAITSVYITTSDSGSDITPSVTFISELPANSVTEVPFAITPHQATNITFNISYQNGDIKREESVVMSVNPGNAKDAAVPTINNLALTSSGNTYDLTGDITNTGVTDANGVVVSVGLPAKGTGTYPEYAVGSLASDDSSSFEVTFTCTDLSSVPLVIHWKDSNGTDYSVTKTLDLTTYSNSSGGMPSDGTSSSTRSSSSSSSMQGPGGDMGGMSGGPGGSSSSSSSSVLSSITNPKGGISSFYPVIAMVVLIIVGVVGYTKRKWIMSKLKKQ
ncbi:hypothetical protein [Methanoregula sp.]|uniref:hypothetical protein n=1 Tax=Methanoregula sp. TaxID=2052170 RepID=UPI0023701171|nr:hypothetical protein [Methanoregula sp.]MDD1687416.1 hypothetical protein [Methanoregula sp.]